MSKDNNPPKPTEPKDHFTFSAEIKGGVNAKPTTPPPPPPKGQGGPSPQVKNQGGKK